ncbi:hypothetical protein ACJJTC_004746 [Scirpophaga incertulas]
MAKGNKNEEELERRRVARRERYNNLKNDSERYALEKEKKRAAYLKRKNENKVKSIKDMSPREQRIQRKRWRENSNRYLKKKINERQVSTIIVDDSPITESNLKAGDSLSDPLTENVREKGDYNKNLKYYLNKIKLLRLKHAKEKKEMSLLINRYKNRCQIMTKINKNLNKKLQKQKNENDEYNSVIPSLMSNSSDNIKEKTGEQTKIKYRDKIKDRSNLNLRKKCMNDNFVKCGKDVGDFKKFLRVVRENVKNVDIRAIEEHEILEKDVLLPKDISPFKGTMSVHQVIWNKKSEFIEFRKLSCFDCVNKICDHGNKHMQLHKIYKSATALSVENVKIIPPSKQIQVLSDIPVQLLNVRSNKVSTPELRSVRKSKTVVKLVDVKNHWINQTFVNNKLKVSGHEEEFFRFIEQDN